MPVLKFYAWAGGFANLPSKMQDYGFGQAGEARFQQLPRGGCVFFRYKRKDMSDIRQQIIAELQVAYWMEIETVTNYIANSVNLDGVRAEEIKKALQADVQEELTHAQTLARRIKTIGGIVPGSAGFKSAQTSLQPRSDTTDVASVIKGVIDAEDSAIAQYNKIIKLCDGVDYVTQDLCIQSLADEEQHRRDFVGYLSEYEQRP